MTLNAGAHLFIDVDDGHFVLRARQPLAGLLAAGADAVLGGILDFATGDWHVPIERTAAVRALAAEANAVVLGAAAPFIGGRAGDAVTGRLIPEALWGQVTVTDADATVAHARSDGRCDGCGRSGAQPDPDIVYDDDTATATIVGTSMLCERCDLLAHHGKSRMKSLERVAATAAHTVNGWDEATRKAAWRADGERWIERSYDDDFESRDWTLARST